MDNVELWFCFLQIVKRREQTCGHLTLSHDYNQMWIEKYARHSNRLLGNNQD